MTYIEELENIYGEVATITGDPEGTCIGSYPDWDGTPIEKADTYGNIVAWLERKGFRF